ncbi:MAG: epimerase [Polaromonas sp.]|nr:epimerase [Gemmatimonadaceae bacterium]
MNVLLLGATGMVGQGVLRECLLASDVLRVTTLGRTATGQTHAKLDELVHASLYDLSPIESRLTPYDACFFCLGVSSAGMSEQKYTVVTHDLTLSVARTLARLNPGMTFVYVSGMGTYTTEHGRSMWARVKGRTENALLRLPFKAAFMFRPGAIMPMHGVRSKTALYRAAYVVLTPLYPLIKRLSPNAVTTSEQVGRAMLQVARHGYPDPVLETADINAL